MNILIINLPKFKGSSVTREGRCEFVCNYRVDTPATLLIIASILRFKNHQIDFIDANALNLDYLYLRNLLKHLNADCLIFTFNSWIIGYDLKICEIVKKINPLCITIGYSWFAKNAPTEVLSGFPYLDIQIINDPFTVIENLIDILEKKGDLNKLEGIAFRVNKNKFIVNNSLKITKDFSTLPIPAYDLIKSFKPYYLYTPLIKPYALIYAGKGCPYSCAYCPDANTLYSGRSADDMVKELKVLKKLWNIKYVWFYDQVFTINRKRVIEFCIKLIEEDLKINWFCDTRVDLVDEKLLKIMKMAGCIGIAYGIESGSQTILNNMKKTIKINQAIKALRGTRKARIPIQLNLILGYIGENKRSLKETKNFVKLTLPELMQISIILAMNGTEFTDLAIKNNWTSDILSLKEKITDIPLDKNHYKPFQLNLQKEIKELYKILFLNPRWWIKSIYTLVKNYQLILPILGIFLYRSKSIKII
ncbi:MAG: B12-binding domain-containing radical SAM protein [Promethearchaeota archaeon]